MSMRQLNFWIRILGCALLASLLACFNEGGSEDPKVSTTKKPSAGSIRVTLTGPTTSPDGHTSVAGAIYTGPTPTLIIWTEVAKSGNCRLLTPRTPFCASPCGRAACVADNTCEEYPTLVTAGTIVVSGIKTTQGESRFSMTPLLKRYQLVGITPAYPPFSEGDEVSIQASGDSTIPAFSISAKGISPLKMLSDSLAMADGKPLVFEWVASGAIGISTVEILVDLSHHGGSKGIIECEGADQGRLEIAATLVDQLKALGVSGFPKAEIVRRSLGSNADVKVDLALESPVSLTLSVPGLISCSSDEMCPSGQTCRPDLQCK